MRSFAAAARRRGVEVTLATDRCHVMEDPWGDRALAVRFEEPEESALELVSGLRGMGTAIDGVIAVGDKPTVVAARTAALLGLPWHAASAAAVCRDKHRMRALFSEAGLSAPRYFLTTEPECDAEFPCVLKPRGLSGSRGVIRANNRAEFVAAFERIRRILEDSEAAVQVEQYIPGREFALEGLMAAGELQVLAIFDKPDPLEGPFFEETIYVTPSRETAEVQDAIVRTTRRAAQSLGLSHGPIHAEMRVNETGVYMLEIAARPIGGLCSKALQFEAGTLEELLILHAIGELPDELKPKHPCAGVMMIPVPRAGIFEGVSGVEAARQTPGVSEVVITAKAGEKLTPLPEGASYTGFVFAHGPEPGFVTGALRQAHSRLQFHVLTALEVLGN